MRKLVIFGTRQIAEVCGFYFDHDSEYEVVAYTIDGPLIRDDLFQSRPVIPFEEIASRFKPAEHDMFIAVGYSKMNRLRAEKFDAGKALGYQLARYVSTKSYTWPGLTIGENTFIMEANVIQPFVSIGADTIIWSGNHIGHHSRIGHHCFLASHVVVSGDVEIGDYCFIGVNATLRNGIKVGQRCLIGAAALIRADTGADEVYAPLATGISRAPSSRISP